MAAKPDAVFLADIFFFNIEQVLKSHPTPSGMWGFCGIIFSLVHGDPFLCYLLAFSCSFENLVIGLGKLYYNVALGRLAWIQLTLGFWFFNLAKVAVDVDFSKFGIVFCKYLFEYTFYPFLSILNLTWMAVTCMFTPFILYIKNSTIILSIYCSCGKVPHISCWLTAQI